MKRQFSQLSNRHKQQHIYFTIPITKYFNRANNKKSGNKTDVKIEVLKERFHIKEQNSFGEWTTIDIVAFDTIDKIEDKEKTEEKYTLVKIEFNNVTEKEKQDKAITFRMQDIMKGREMSAFIKNFIKKRAEYLENTLKRLNYIKIQERQENAMKYIIEMENQYNEVFRKAAEKSLFPPGNKSSAIEFQRTLLSDHPEMKKFYLLKHTLKYEQQKNILLQKLNQNADENHKQELREKQHRFNRLHNKEISIDESNINLHMIEEDLNKINKEGKQALEGYSSKNEFEGVNVAGGEEELYQKIKPAPYDLNERNQVLILSNIKNMPEAAEQSLMDELYNNYMFQNSLRKGLSSDRKNPQKMQIQDGQIPDFYNHSNAKNSSIKHCQKMKITEVKDIRLQQKKQQPRHQKKSDIKFIDPSYNPQKELSITKQTTIWCSLFYHYLKEGGIEKREHQLTVIENQLKRLKHLEKDTRMNECVAKMVDKVSANFLKIKRGQDIY